MNARARVAGLLGAAAIATAACCPCPLFRHVLVRPSADVKVVDAKTRAPIAGATVMLRRFNLGPPPRREWDRWTEVTGSAGVVTFTYEKQGIWDQPFLLHGVRQFAWEVCADAPGYRPTTTTWFVAHSWNRPRSDQPFSPTLEVPLTVGTGGCPQSGAFMEFYAPGVKGTYSDAIATTTSG